MPIEGSEILGRTPCKPVSRIANSGPNRIVTVYLINYEFLCRAADTNVLEAQLE